MKSSSGNASILPETCFFGALWAIWFIWFYRFWPAWEDHAVFHLMAADWLRGGKPYVDVVDPNWPGTLFIHCAAFLLGGFSNWGIRLIDTVLQCWLAATTFRWLAAWKVGRIWRITAAVLFAISYMSGTFISTAQRESLALPFVLYGLLPWLLPAGPAERISRPRLFLLHGIALGIAVVIKPPLALIMVAVGLGTLWRGEITRKRWLECVLWSATGGFLVPALVAVLFYERGCLSGFWQWGIHFAFTDYGKDMVPFGTRLIHTGIWLYNHDSLTLLVLFAASLLWLWRRSHVSTFLKFSLYFTLGCLASALSQGRISCRYHFIPLFYALSIISIILLNQAWPTTNARPRRWIYSGIGVLLLVRSIGFSLLPQTQLAGFLLGEKLRQELKPDENVLMLGFSPTIYLSLQRLPPYPIQNSMQLAMLSEAAQRLEEDRIVAALSRPNLHYFIIDGIACATMSPVTRVDRRPKISAYLQSHFLPGKIESIQGNPYAFSAPIDYLLYERKPSTRSATPGSDSTVTP